MKRQCVATWAIVALLLTAVSAVAFLLLFASTPTFWVAYGAAAFAMVVLAATLSGVMSPKLVSQQRLYRTARVRWAALYAGVQAVASLGIMALQAYLPFSLTLLVPILLAVVFGILLILSREVEVVVEAQEPSLTEQPRPLRTAQARLATQIAEAPSELAQALRKLVEAIRWSDPCPPEALLAEDQALLAAIEALQGGLAREDLSQVLNEVAALHRRLEARNVRCKALKS